MVPNRRNIAPATLYFGLVAFSLAGLCMQKFTGREELWIGRIASLLTLAMAVWAALEGSRPKPNFKTVLLILSIGAAFEVLGMYTGFPFGRYVYTGAWWPSLPLPGEHQFPLPLPFAWLLVVLGSASLYQRFVKKTGVLVGAVGVGFIAALVDLPMELPMTQTLKYWRWESTSLFVGAPLQNFFGWVLVSSVGAFFLLCDPSFRIEAQPGPEPAVGAGRAWPRGDAKSKPVSAGFILLTHLLFSMSVWLIGVPASP